MIRAALSALILLAAPASGRVQDGDVAGRARMLADEAAIERLILDYGRHLDALDFASFAALFADDAEYNGQVGPAAIEASMNSAFGPGSGTVWTDDFHIVGNILIDVDGDTASAASRWIFVSPGADAGAGRTVHPVLAGRYNDTFVRTPDGWRFASRALVNDMAMDGFPGVRPGWETE